MLRSNNFVNALSADVVASTFEHCPRDVAIQFLAKNIGKQWKIVCCKLILQGLGVGGHNNPFARRNERHEISKCFTSACACLNNEVTFSVDSEGDSYSHFILALTFFGLR